MLGPSTRKGCFRGGGCPARPLRPRVLQGHRGLGAPGLARIVDWVLRTVLWPVPGPAACERVLGVSGSASRWEVWASRRFVLRARTRPLRLQVLSSRDRPPLCGQLRALWLPPPHRGDGGRPGCLDEALQVRGRLHPAAGPSGGCSLLETLSHVVCTDVLGLSRRPAATVVRQPECASPRSLVRALGQL